MKQSFKLFIMPEQNHELCAFLNALNQRKNKFTVTPWDSTTGNENGFCVWFYTR